jgi:hypothetical protein
MTITLREIQVTDYSKEKQTLYSLVEEIWTRDESLDNIKHSLDRWGESGNETGTYFYIEQDGRTIGLTGYFIPNEDGDFGLRHHGTKVKGTGKLALDELLNYLKNAYESSFKRLIELIPEGKEELIQKFESWGFILSEEAVPWEPKKDYYKYVMIWSE